MRYLILVLIGLVVLSSCQIKEQADQLKALEKCTYELVSADSMYIAGKPVNRFMNNGKLNLMEAPALAFAFIQQKVPVKGIIKLKVTNPGTEEAGLNEFEYKVLIKGTELLTGFVNQKIIIPGNGGSTIVPIAIDKDIYGLISDRNNQQAVTDFLNTDTEKFTDVTFKIKPTFLIGTEKVAYPDFIDIHKKISNTQIVSYVNGLNISY